MRSLHSDDQADRGHPSGDLKEKLKPEFVSPLVLYLCSDQCPESGAIYNAGMGCYSRAAVVTGSGTIIGDGTEIPSAEQIAEKFSQIASLDNAVEFMDSMAALSAIFTADSSPAADAPKEETPAEMTVKSVFERMPDAFQADKAQGIDVVFQYRITGPGGGEWFVVIKDQACEITKGKHEKPTTTIIMSDDDFRALIRKELNAMQAFTSGKLKIEGDLMKSQLAEKLFKF